LGLTVQLVFTKASGMIPIEIPETRALRNHRRDPISVRPHSGISNYMPYPDRYVNTLYRRMSSGHSMDRSGNPAAGPEGSACIAIVYRKVKKLS
jgi:hypothetical protein